MFTERNLIIKIIKICIDHLKKNLVGLKKLDLPKNFINVFIEECKKRKCNPIITPFTHESIKNIKNKKLKAIKIASYDSTSYPLLKNLKELNLPFIISTGATTNKQISKTSDFMKKKFLHYFIVLPFIRRLCIFAIWRKLSF